MKCPNCGFYKVDSKTSFEEVGRKSVGLGGILFYGFIVAWFSVIGWVPCLIVIFLGYPIGWIIGIVWTSVWALYFKHMVTDTTPIREADGELHDCRHCGYGWFTSKRMN